MNPFTNYSKTGAGLAIVTILELVLPLVGIEVPEGTVAGTVESVALVIGYVLVFYGQFKRQDLIGGIKRK